MKTQQLPNLRLDTDPNAISRKSFGDLHLDWVTSLASHYAGAPIALLSVCLPSGMEFLAVRGIGADAEACSNTLRGRNTLCEKVAREGDIVVVRNRASEVVDQQIVENMMSVKMESYFGVPLRTSSGLLIGTLCVGDHVTREWKIEEVEYLVQLAESVCLYMESAVSENVRSKIKIGLPNAVSHLVRTSLTGMQASLELLVDDTTPMTPAQARLTEIAYRNCMDLMETMRQLLVLADEN